MTQVSIANEVIGVEINVPEYLYNKFLTLKLVDESGVWTGSQQAWEIFIHTHGVELV